MPQLISLAAYNIKVWNTSDHDYELLSDFDGNGGDLLEVLHKVLTDIKANTLDDEKDLQQAIAIDKIEKTSRIISGIIQTGDYGRESKIVNVETKEPSYHRTKKDAELWPFYFLLDIPEGVEDGILILQRSSHYGIRKLLHWVLGTAFSNKNPEHQLRLRSLVDESEVQRLANGVVQKISFLRKTIPPDAADAWDKGHKEIKGYMELSIYASRGHALPINSWLVKLFKGGAPAGVFAIDDGDDFSYENVKARIHIGRSTRTINAAHPIRLRSYHEITDIVNMGTDGHPKYESIHAEAEKLANKFKPLLYGAGAS